MRKLLLNSTAIATVAALTASVAVADVSISATTEYKYESRSSQKASDDGTRGISTSEIVFKFANKTDSGLTVGYVAELTSTGEAGGEIDESSFSIAGGFGKVVLGENDGVGENFGISALDLIAEETLSTVASNTITENSDIVQTAGDKIKIAYFLPAMGGFTAGMSHANSGATTGTDSTTWGAAYTMEAAGNTVTIGGATTTTDVSGGTDTDSQNIGLKVVSGNLSVTISNGTYEAADEDNNSSGVAASYKLANGMTLGAYSVKSEDDLDVGEEYTASGVEASYTIAAGLTAVVTVNDYEYTKQTESASAGQGTVNDSGTTSSLTIKAAF